MKNLNEQINYHFFTNQYSHFNSYKKIGIDNLKRTSRTAQDGTIDVSSVESSIPDSCLPIFSSLKLASVPSLCKENFDQLHLNETQIQDLIKSNEKISSLNVVSLINKTQDQIKQLVISNYETAMEESYKIARQHPVFLKSDDVKKFIIKMVHILGKDIIDENHWFREHNSTKYLVYTQVNDLSVAFNNFVVEFYNKYQILLQVKDSAKCLSTAIDMAAWIEYRLNLTDHFIADNCGKVAALLGNFIFMSADIHPDNWPIINRKDYFDKNFLPKIRRDTDPMNEMREYETWCKHYRSSFFPKLNKEKINDLNEEDRCYYTPCKNSGM